LATKNRADNAVLSQVNLYQFSKIKDYDDFGVWWQSIVLRNWRYESQDEGVINFLLIIDVQLVAQHFKILPLDALKIRPKYP